MRRRATIPLIALASLAAGPAAAQDGAAVAAAERFVADLETIGSEWATATMGFAGAWANGELLRAVTYLMVLLMIAAGSELLFWCYGGPALRALRAVRPTSPRQRALVGAEQLALRAFGVALSTGAALAATEVLTLPPVVTAIATVVAISTGALRAVMLLAGYLLAPRIGSHRIWPWTDATARRVHAYVLAIAATAWAGYVAAELLGVFAAPDVGRAAASVAAVLTGLMLLAALSAWSRTRRASRRPGRRGLADLLPFSLAALLAAGTVLWFIGWHRWVWTLVVLAVLVVADFAGAAILHALLRGDPDETEQEPDAIGLARAYEPVIRRFLRFCLALIAFVIILAIWRVDMLMPEAAERPVVRVVAQSINVVAVVLLCDLAWLWLRTFIDRQLRMSVRMGDGEAASRLSTLLPMIRTAVLILLVGLTTLVALSAIGVNIAPLLAGAGVVGLAIGFGAQTLVRDIITGVFFLIEDAFRVGEYIDVGSRKGTVEAISLRSVRLRHQRGALHTVPFGEIKSVSNESRDWSIVKLEFRIPFDTDLAQVKRIIKGINADLIADPDLGPNLLEPLKSQGINRFDDYGMVLRVKYTAKPNSTLFIIRREAYQRIRDAFDRAGIRLGERSVKVEMAGRGLPDGIAAAGAADSIEEPPPRPA